MMEPKFLGYRPNPGIPLGHGNCCEGSPPQPKQGNPRDGKVVQIVPGLYLFILAFRAECMVQKLENFSNSMTSNISAKCLDSQ